MSSLQKRVVCAIADQEQEETQQKSDLDNGFTALLSCGHTEPGVMGKAKLAATAGQPL